MSDKKHIETSEDFVQAFDELFENILLESSDEADHYLRASGYDPDVLGREMAEFAQQAADTSPLDWRNQVQEYDEEKERYKSFSRGKRGNRVENKLYARKLFEQLSSRPASVAAAFRNLDQLSDEDLISLLDQLEYLTQDRDGEE